MSSPNIAVDNALIEACTKQQQALSGEVENLCAKLLKEAQHVRDGSGSSMTDQAEIEVRNLQKMCMKAVNVPVEGAHNALKGFVADGQELDDRSAKMVAHASAPMQALIPPTS